MRAIVAHAYGSPDVLIAEEVPTPTPADGEVRVRIHAASATRSDAEMRKGGVARLAAGLTKPKHPIPGAEFAGEIDAVGPNVTLFNVGDRVMGQTGLAMGGYAEYVVVPEDGPFVPVPEGASYEEAVALVEGMLTALAFLNADADIRPGTRVLINGAAGAVGSAAVQVARHLGATVTGVCGAANVEFVESLGADEVIDYKRSDFTQQGRAYDVIFDAVGLSSFSACRKALAPNGIYLTTVPSIRVLVDVARTSLFGNRKARIIFSGLRTDEKKLEDLNLISEMWAAGEIKAVVDRVFPLEQAAEAHRYIDQGHKRGNVVLTA
ncbi:MAG TPA: NAD(P)-dependent alcohol dehydrogenase [Coriobacteriia bacterium]|nr:NAD(P)-dependent alcohol dehydrogenase [Coriobacteriia bacterium]